MLQNAKPTFTSVKSQQIKARQPHNPITTRALNTKNNATEVIFDLHVPLQLPRARYNAADVNVM